MLFTLQTKPRSPTPAHADWKPVNPPRSRGGAGSSADRYSRMFGIGSGGGRYGGGCGNPFCMGCGGRDSDDYSDEDDEDDDYGPGQFGSARRASGGSNDDGGGDDDGDGGGGGDTSGPNGNIAAPGKPMALVPLTLPDLGQLIT